MATAAFAEFFKDKTVTLLGLGLLGRGVGDAAFLARYCKKVFVTDMKSAEELRVSVDALKEFGNIEFFLGGHEYRIFEGVDFVIKGAGVRLDNPYIAHARKNDVPVYMSTALFAKLSPLRTIGVTGTRGKTSTTCMIAEILTRAGKKVLLGGNLRGVSTLALLASDEAFDIAVLELDSWQLQGFDALGISPNIGVFTNLFPDHMNYYDGDMGLYLHDKAAIFRHQNADDVLVTVPEITTLTVQERVGYRGRWVEAEVLPEGFALAIPGAHNLMNAALAKEVGKICGVSDAVCDATLRGFAGVEGRLQYAGSWQGRAFYNDSNATTQEATLAALKAFPATEIVLIFGGADKGLPVEGLVDFIELHGVRGVLIEGTGSDRVLARLPQMKTVRTMPDAVAAAAGLSRDGDKVILSPAFASFGAFKNEYDRSDQFMGEVRKLIAGGASCRR